jgi:hypothetical protein
MTSSSRFSSDITTSTDENGLVITTAQKVLHVTCINGIPYVWFDATPDDGKWASRPCLRGMTAEGASFYESAPMAKTFEDLFAIVKQGWSQKFILGSLSYEERLPILQEYAEMKGGQVLEDFHADLARHEARKQREEAKAARRKAAHDAFTARHPVGSKLEVHGKTYRIAEYTWDSLRCVQLGKWDLESTKEAVFYKYAVLAQDLHVDTAQACAILSGDEDLEEEQHGKDI